MWYARISSNRSHTGYAAILDSGNPSTGWVRDRFERVVRLDPRSLAAAQGRFAIIDHGPEDFARIVEMCAEEGGAVGSIRLGKIDAALDERLEQLIAARDDATLAAAIRAIGGFRPVESMAFEFQQYHYIVTADGFWHVAPDDPRTPERAFTQIKNVLVRITDPVPG